MPPDMSNVDVNTGTRPLSLGKKMCHEIPTQIRLTLYLARPGRGNQSGRGGDVLPRARASERALGHP